MKMGGMKRLSRTRLHHAGWGCDEGVTMVQLMQAP